MSTSVPCGKYTFLKERDQLEGLIERYDSFLFGACMRRRRCVLTRRLRRRAVVRHRCAAWRCVGAR